MKTITEATAVALLLTNLRLLELPLLSDLPINEETFSQGRNKSKAFEHIVHHIFDRYDPAESKSRFAGNWPIYEPAQSKNFRAVIVNWLNDLKKTGSLHNAVIIRKSMFDECQGDRYEELLLSLSTMALRRVLERERGNATQGSIAFDESLSVQPDKDVVNVLSIAYQNSLRKILQKRFVDKKKWFLASRRLDEQDRLVSEKGEATATARESRKEVEAKGEDITSTWEKNWLGDQNIYRVLLSSDEDNPEKDFWSNASFQRLLQTGAFLKPHSAKNAGATLEEMDETLKMHESRLARWTEYNDRFLKDKLGYKKSVSGKKVSFAADVEGGFGIGFNKHQNLHASAFTLQEGAQLPIPSTEDEYGNLFNNMRKELQTIRVSRRKLGSLSYASTYGDTEGADQEPVLFDEPKPSSLSREMTEEEALKLLSAHLPLDASVSKSGPMTNPLGLKPNISRPTPAPPQVTDIDPAQIRQSPKPRLRSPPPPPLVVSEAGDDPDDSPEDAILQYAASPELPYEEHTSTIASSIRRGKTHPPEEDSNDFLVERIITQIATSTDTPAPGRLLTLNPGTTQSREELEEDPFKPRPKVALSPHLAPYRFHDTRAGKPETPKVGFSLAESEDDEDDEYEEEDSYISPSKGRGLRYR